MSQKIFTFWEPKDRLTPYLALCMETWAANLGDYEIVVLDFENLHDYLPADVFDLDVISRIPLRILKDAIQVGLLREDGGIFMDVDTIAIRDIKPILRRLDSTGMVMFNEHMAFIAARPKSVVLRLMWREIERKLIALKDQPGDPLDIEWDYLGNSELATAKHALVDQSRLYGAPQRTVNAIERFAAARSKRGRSWRLAARAMAFTGHKVRVASERIGMATHLRKHVIALDRDRYGFIAEHGYTGIETADPEQRYLDFWFSDDIALDDAFRPAQTVIGLHNSWTPDWYRELDREAVLQHGSLLSRTLRRALSL